MKAIQIYALTIKIRRQFVVKHMQNDCHEHGILCEYEDIGCKPGRITRKNMPNHMRDYIKKTYVAPRTTQ